MSLKRKRGVVPSSNVDIIDLCDTDDDDDGVKVLNFIPPINPSTKRRKLQRGESSNDAPFVCEICTDTKTTKDSFSITGCSHAYCSDCVATYVATMVEKNVIYFGCPVPGCSGRLTPENCCVILPAEMLDRWLRALYEATIKQSHKLYCPFADCSALLVNDRWKKVRKSECPYCRRLFCAQCKVPWHGSINCNKFQMLNKDELVNLAEDNKWKKCPHCNIYVEKIGGCQYMQCRSTFISLALLNFAHQYY
ncbi:E3 ubiquitin-protein ligase RSL1-like [Lotus japonicus]|uniref:E3 ubiquitin-protein ligase RSL1-like n=1 Tax=Lotus japonicus TaxID=34305 RepID=UPI00258BED6C|nr:E3 ubiquitin-protein ligase RSL1-like [Lotus japonicus]